MVNGRILCYDKQNRTPRMGFIDYGLGLFNPEAFLHLTEDHPADLSEVYQLLIKEMKLLAYETKQRFYEIGSYEGLRELDRLLARDPNQFLRRDH
jgi:N-acetyl-alpha-D-muramate 1-phosphate uridylyltransferase